MVTSMILSFTRPIGKLAAILKTRSTIPIRPLFGSGFLGFGAKSGTSHSFTCFLEQSHFGNCGKLVNEWDVPDFANCRQVWSANNYLRDIPVKPGVDHAKLSQQCLVWQMDTKRIKYLQAVD